MSGRQRPVCGALQLPVWAEACLGCPWLRIFWREQGALKSRAARWQRCSSGAVPAPLHRGRDQVPLPCCHPHCSCIRGPAWWTAPVQRVWSASTCRQASRWDAGRQQRLANPGAGGRVRGMLATAGRACGTGLAGRRRVDGEGHVLLWRRLSDGDCGSHPGGTSHLAGPPTPPPFLAARSCGQAPFAACTVPTGCLAAQHPRTGCLPHAPRPLRPLAARPGWFKLIRRPAQHGRRAC